MIAPAWDDLRKHLPADHVAAFDAFVEMLESDRDDWKARAEQQESEAETTAADMEAVLLDLMHWFHGLKYGLPLGSDMDALRGRIEGVLGR